MVPVLRKRRYRHPLRNKISFCQRCLNCLEPLNYKVGVEIKDAKEVNAVCVKKNTQSTAELKERWFASRTRSRDEKLKRINNIWVIHTESLWVTEKNIAENGPVVKLISFIELV